MREALDRSGVPVLGVLRRVKQVDTPARHLGLVPVAERRAEAVEAVAAMAAQVSDGCDLDALTALARGAGALSCGAWAAAEAVASSPPPQPFPSSRGSAPSAPPGGSAPRTPIGLNGRRPQAPDRLVVAVAGGEAFSFSYAEHSELLAAAGAEVVPFDPLRDEAAARRDARVW